MQGKSLFDRHIHLGLGGRAIPQPEFTGDMSWYEDYDPVFRGLRLMR